MRICEDLARHDALDEALHRDSGDQRQRSGGIDGCVEGAGIGARFMPVEGVSHPELDVGHGDAAAGAQLDRALPDRTHLSFRIEELDASARTRGHLAQDLRPHSLELRGQLRGLRPRAGFGRVAFGEDGVLARVDDVAGNSVDLPDRGDAGLHSP